MTNNALVAAILAFVGIGDIVIARVLAGKLPPIARTVLVSSGVVFLAAAAVFATRLVQI